MSYPKPNLRLVEVKPQQHCDVLKREQQTLGAVIRVLEQTRSKTPSHSELFRAARAAVLGTSHWVDGCEDEMAAVRFDRERPCWIWTAKDQFRAQILANAIGPVDTRVRFTCPECGEVYQIQTARELVSQLLTCSCGCQLDFLRASSAGNLRENPCPDWAIAKGRALLCHILRCVPCEAEGLERNPFETAWEGLNAGIVPVLYKLLRSEYLRDARTVRAWRDGTK